MIQTCNTVLYLPCDLIDDYIAMQNHMLNVQRDTTETILTGFLFPWAYFTADQISAIQPYFPEVSKQLSDNDNGRIPRGFIAFHNNSVSSTLEMLNQASDGSGGGGASFFKLPTFSLDASNEQDLPPEQALIELISLFDSVHLTSIDPAVSSATIRATVVEWPVGPPRAADLSIPGRCV